MMAAAERRDWLEPHPITRRVTRDLFAWGVPASLGAFADFASRRVDNLLVSSIWGPSVMGTYNLAYNLADIPAVQVGEQIGDVLLPSFAQMEPARRGPALLRSTALLALIMFPLAIGLGAVAPTAVHAIFDQRWVAVGPMLLFLSSLSVTRPVGWTTSSYLLARERPRAVMMLEWFKLGALVMAIETVGRLSPLWACVAVGIAFALHTLASLWLVQHMDGIPVVSFLARLAPPLLACAPMVGAVLGVRWLRLHFGLTQPLVGLALESTAGGLAYVGAALVIARSTSQELLRLLKHGLRR
jgi:PST family polysaccharide transporter